MGKRDILADPAASTRAPRGTRIVAQAFFTALADIPAARQADVAKAAQLAIRDRLKLERDKTKAAGKSTAAKSNVVGKSKVA